jgi:hypothetical protein
MTSPISISSSGSGVGTLRVDSGTGAFFFSKILASSLPQKPESKSADGMTKPSRSSSSSSVSVSGREAEVEEVEPRSKPRVE